MASYGRGRRRSRKPSQFQVCCPTLLPEVPRSKAQRAFVAVKVLTDLPTTDFPEYVVRLIHRSVPVTLTSFFPRRRVSRCLKTFPLTSHFPLKVPVTLPPLRLSPRTFRLG